MPRITAGPVTTGAVTINGQPIATSLSQADAVSLGNVIPRSDGTIISVADRVLAAATVTSLTGVSAFAHQTVYITNIGANPARIGDTFVTTGQGVELTAGASMVIETLAAVSAISPLGTTLTVTATHT